MAKTPDAVADPRGYQQSQGAGGATSDAGLRTHLRVHGARRFVPEEHEGEPGDAPVASWLTVDLGGEAMRCLTRLVVDDDTVVIEVTGVCFTKNHPFRQHDFVAVKRARHMSGRDEWRATSRNAVDEAQYAMLFEKRRQRLMALAQAQKKEAPKRRREAKK